VEKLSKNFFWMAAANISSSILSITLFIYLARALAPESFGLLSYIFTLVFFLANFIDLGLSTYGMREIAKDRSRATQYLSEIASLRILIASGLCLLFLVSGLVVRDAHQLKLLMFASSIIFFMWALGSEWAFQGLEKMHVVFLSMVTTGALQLGLMFLFVKSSVDLPKVPILYFAASVPMAVVLLTRLRFRLIMKSDELKRIAGYLSSSFAIWGISIFAQIYNSLDVFILGLSRSPEEVGYYTVARRFTGTIALLLVFLAGAVFPSLSSSAFQGDSRRFKIATGKFLTLAVFIAVFALVPLILFSRSLVTFVVGSEYAPASEPLRIMAIGLLIVLFNLPFSTGLIASGYEKDVLKQAFASAVLSISSNFILMPKYGMLGGSISFVLAESLALVWILFLYRSKIKREG